MGSRFFTFLPVAGSETAYVVWHPKAAAPARTTRQPGANDQVVVFVPGTEAVMHRTRIPGRRASEVLRAAAFAIEDELAVPAERTHVAVSDVSNGAGMRSVFAVADTDMKNWVAALDGARMANYLLVPELSVVPESGTLYDFGDRVLGYVDQRAIAVDANWPTDVKHAVFKATARESEFVADPLLQLAQWAGEATPLIDLRQGAYARGGQTVISLDTLKTPAMLVAALAFVGLLHLGLSVRAMNQLDAALQAAALSTFRNAFAVTEAPGDLAAAARAKLASGPDLDNDFVSMSALLYSALESTPGVALTSLRYEGDTGELRATLTYPAFGADLQIKSAAEAQGGVVRLGDTRLEDNRVVGDLTLEMGR